MSASKIPRGRPRLPRSSRISSDSSPAPPAFTIDTLDTIIHSLSMSRSNNDCPVNPDGTIVWDDDNENALLQLLLEYKPIGINKHFHMMITQFGMSHALGREVTVNEIKKHISTLYNLEEMDKDEPIPFPHKRITDFKLTSKDKQLETLLEQKNKSFKEQNKEPESNTSSSSSNPQPQKSSFSKPKDISLNKIIKTKTSIKKSK